MKSLGMHGADNWVEMGGASRLSPTFFAILWSFLKLAPVSFGGGYAIFPALEKEMIAHRQWMTDRELTETLSLAAAAPGGVGVNAALLLGYRLKGIAGAAAAGIGSIVPTFAIVLGMFLLYQRTGDLPKIRAALGGVTWGIIALILFAAMRMGRSAIRDKFTAGLTLAALCCLLAGVPPLCLIAGGALAGIAVSWAKNGRKGGKAYDSPETSHRGIDESAYMYYI